MSNAQDIQKVELTIEEAHKAIDRRDMLARLQNNKDFQTLIEDGFFRDHAIRQVELKSHPSAQGEKQKFAIDSQITAIGGFRQYLVGIKGLGDQAAEALDSHEQTLEDLNNEGAQQ